jgi:hypothetical protein
MCKARRLDMVHSSHRILGLALSMTVPATIATGCGPFQPHEIPDEGVPDEGALSGAGGNGGAGGLGQGGSEPSFCEPGMARNCYTGALGTEGIGNCQGGVETCDETGKTFGPCANEITPQAEACWNNVDDDCNGKTDSVAECLVGRGLIVRYFINEAESGQGPGKLEDAAPDPLTLAIKASPELSFTTVDGHRGLRWTGEGQAGMASSPIDGTKIQLEMGGSTSGTIELVAQVESVTGMSRLSHIGIAHDDVFSPASASTDSFRFYLNEPDHTKPVEFPISHYYDLGRIVMHLVLDTSLLAATSRVKLYINGGPISINSDEANLPDPNEMIQLLNDHHYVLGNAQGGDRSFRGTLFYAAMYSAALTHTEVATNAALLQIDDDAL